MVLSSFFPKAFSNIVKSKVSAAFSLVSSWAEEIRAMARLSGYQPAYLREANAAANIDLTSLSHVMAYLKLIQPQIKPQSPTINNNIINQPELIQNQILTPTMAVKLLEEKGLNALPKNKAMGLEAIYFEENIADMPDVKAIPSDAQGVNRTKSIDFSHIPIERGDRRMNELEVLDGQIE